MASPFVNSFDSRQAHVIGASGRFALAFVFLALVISCTSSVLAAEVPKNQRGHGLSPVLPSTLNQKGDGYRGVWYNIRQIANGKRLNRYKYSGGLGTYCAKHRCFAIYRPEVQKTFFCYGGATPTKNRHLLHMVSYYDHKTGTVPRPTILIDKQTSDAHDNPVMAIDDAGHLWIFSSSHGTARPSFIHRSKNPYDINEFEMISPKRKEAGRTKLIDNFSYMQAYHVPQQGFQCLFTRYHDPAARTSFFMSSRDGLDWSTWKRLACIEQGHYQVGAATEGKVATMMNYHPKGQGLDWRTNLYYMESTDGGASWTSADGTLLDLPLTQVKNDALIRDYQSEGLLVYLKDLQFDSKGQPVLLYVTCRDNRPGPKSKQHKWQLARWNDNRWKFSVVTESDHNYDMGSLYLEEDDLWRLIAPTEPGPQPYQTGGEMVMWTSRDQGATWQKQRQLTKDSERNHSYARRPVNAHPDFFAFWADGNPDKSSESALYYSSKEGEVYRLPTKIEGASASPERVFVSPK